MKENKTQCRWFHKWSKWIDLEKPHGDEHITFKQIKECNVCGIKKGRSVTYVRKVF